MRFSRKEKERRMSKEEDEHIPAGWKSSNFFVRWIGERPEDTKKFLYWMGVIRGLSGLTVLTLGVFIKQWNFSGVYAFVWMAELGFFLQAATLQEDTSKSLGLPRAMFYNSLAIMYFHLLLIINICREIDVCSAFSETQRQQIASCLNSISMGSYSTSSAVECTSLVKQIDDASLPS